MDSGKGNSGRRPLLLFVLALFLFALPAGLLWLAPLRGPKQISETENRPLTQFPTLTAEAFLSGDFQASLEDAAGDQLLLSEPLRAAEKDAEAALRSLLQQGLYAAAPSLRTAYTPLADGYWAYQGDEHRIVERPDPARLSEQRLQAFAAQINALSGIRKYLFFIENSRSVDFDHMEARDALYDRVRTAFDLDGSDAFRFEDYADFCRLFYQTDHHWNHRGSLLGCRRILTLLGLQDDLPESPREITLPAVFNGSYARQTRLLRADEPFAVFDLPLPDHTETLNGRRGAYGHLSAYLRGRCPDDALRNHYAFCYGGDYGEIVYDFGTQGRGTLLMLVDSYSNPINGLIAMHFDRTFVIDPRYYEEYAGMPFDPQAYLADHPADTLLLLGDVLFYMGADAGEGGEA